MCGSTVELTGQFMMATGHGATKAPVCAIQYTMHCTAYIVCGFVLCANHSLVWSDVAAGRVNSNGMNTVGY